MWKLLNVESKEEEEEEEEEEEVNDLAWPVQSILTDGMLDIFVSLQCILWPYL
jgi:hypothetical protein